MALVDAHGASNSQHMLPLFESFLEKKAIDDEELYDRVRQGAVVFLGTLARHMEPGSAKVQLPQLPAVFLVSGGKLAGR